MKRLLILVCPIFLVTIARSQDIKPTTFILVRHAEKGDDGTKDPLLSDDGVKRAARLVEVLQETKVTAIYSTNYKRTKNTVTQVAQAKGLEVKTYEPMKEDELKRIIELNKGGTVLIVGHSNTTPWTANFLSGEKLKNFTDAEYGNILIVTYWESGLPAAPAGKASLIRLNY